GRCRATSTVREFLYKNFVPFQWFDTETEAGSRVLAALGSPPKAPVMARPGFKRAWTRLVPQPIERSTYCLFSCVVLILLMWQWRGRGAAIWDVLPPAGRWLLGGLFAAGWLLIPAVSLLINHFDLFGTRQVWLYLRGRPYTPLPFRTPLLYDRVRHPLYVGWALAFWATPTMTLGHLLFAGTLTLYMAVA